MSNTKPLDHKLRCMRKRCEHPGARSSKSYFGRGIRVCRLWRKYPRKFRSWMFSMGWKSGLELHRIDPSGPYAPWNCVLLTSEAHRAVHLRLSRIAPLRSGVLETSGVHGSKQRLTAADVLYIHAHPEKGASELGKELGVRRSTIWNIRAGVTWQDLHPSLGGYARDYSGKRRLVKRVSFTRDKVSHITADDIKWLYANSGCSYEDIAKRLGISTERVKDIFAGRLCAEFFVDGKPPTRPYTRCTVVTKEVVDYIYEHCDVNAEDISVELGIKADRIRAVRNGESGRAFYRNGIPPKYTPKPRCGTGVPLSMEDVASVFLARGYMSADEIANLHGISKSTVYAIWYGSHVGQRRFIRQLEVFLAYTKLL